MQNGTLSIKHRDGACYTSASASSLSVWTVTSLSTDPQDIDFGFAG